jgi:hypothetical protein
VVIDVVFDALMYWFIDSRMYVTIEALAD